MSGRAIAHHLEHLIEPRHPAIDPVSGIDSPAVPFLDIRLPQHLKVGHGDGD